jgi:DNA-binding transcriptional LysR family regulator
MEHSTSHDGSSRLQRMDLNALMLFYETVNARSINKAAMVLDMPKSTISRRLRLLEQQFESTLLKRGARSLSLTETGRALYQRCESIVQELEKANLQTTQFQEEMTGALRVSMPSFFVGWVADALAEFARAHPALQLELESNNRHVDVAEEPFDIAIHFGKPPETFHPARTLAVLSRSFYATPAYLAQAGTPRTYADLAGHDMILHQYQVRDKVFADAGSDRKGVRARVIANNAVMVHEFVLRHLGIGLMPDIMCLEDIASGALHRIDLDWTSPPLLASATYLARRYTPAKTRAFLDHLSAFLQQRAGTGVT